MFRRHMFDLRTNDVTKTLCGNTDGLTRMDRSNVDCSACKYHLALLDANEDPSEPTDATPYMMAIEHRAEGQPVEPVTGHTDAEEAASLISPYPELTEPLDPENGIWQVWLPNYMTKYAWSDGLDINVTTGGYHLFLELDPA